MTGETGVVQLSLGDKERQMQGKTQACAWGQGKRMRGKGTANAVQMHGDTARQLKAE